MKILSPVYATVNLNIEFIKIYYEQKLEKV